MPATLYYTPMSPPCRAVLLTAKAFGVELELKSVNIFEKEQLKQEFIDINPQHTIPTFVDGDLTLWESRAIMQYLANSHGGSGSSGALYPREAKARALVDKMLYFDLGTLYKAFADFAYPVLLQQVKPDPEKQTKVYAALALLEKFLDGHFFAVGNRISIADHALAATVATINASGFDLLPYKNVANWLERCAQQMPGYAQINGSPSQDMGKLMKTKLRI